jgi:tellurite resistance protein TehA-like permease
MTGNGGVEDAADTGSLLGSEQSWVQGGNMNSIALFFICLLTAIIFLNAIISCRVFNCQNSRIMRRIKITKNNIAQSEVKRIKKI